MKKFNQIKISRRKHLVLFTVLPIILWIMGFCMSITAGIDILGTLIFYLPVTVNVICGLFFDTGKRTTSIFDKIPKKVKDASFIVMLILILVVAPILGIVTLINFDFEPKIVPGVSLTDDISLLFIGGLLVLCSVFFWIIVLYAMDAFSAIIFYFNHYFLSILAFIATLALLHRYFVTDDMFFLVMSAITMMLCVGAKIKPFSDFI